MTICASGKLPLSRLLRMPLMQHSAWVIMEYSVLKLTWPAKVPFINVCSNPCYIFSLSISHQYTFFHLLLGRDKRPLKSLVVGRPILLALEDIDGRPSFLEKALQFIENYGKFLRKISACFIDCLVFPKWYQFAVFCLLRNQN